jgi:ABC-type sugar transport system ATPase subunit
MSRFPLRVHASRLTRMLPLLLGAVVPALACSSAPRREVCLGQEYLVVRNETGESVDIYMTRGSLSHIVGTVGTGRTELSFPGYDREGYFRGRLSRNGRWIQASKTNAASRFDIQVECSEPRVP